MPDVRPQRISGHSPYEPVFGFSRALVAGDRVLVAGTAPVPAGGGPPPEGPYAQARLCLDLIGEALAQAGTTLEHVVRTRMYLTAAEHWEQVARAHGEVFAEVMPAATAIARIYPLYLDIHLWQSVAGDASVTGFAPRLP